MQLLYFGWVRQRIGIPAEAVDRPAEVTDVDGLIHWLSSRGEAYAAALADRDTLRIAVNQELCNFDTPVADNDEVALFPPMTGG